MKVKLNSRQRNAALFLSGIVAAAVTSCASVPQTTPSQVTQPQSTSNNKAENVPSPEPPEQSPSPAQQTSEKPQSSNSENFKSFLPPENQELRAFILADSFLNAFLGNVWIGNGVTQQELLQRGFYMNMLYKHTGSGTAPVGEAKGACSPIGFRGSYMCGRGLTAYQWGIQNDEAIERLNVLEEEWGDRLPRSSEPMNSSSQAANPASVQSRVVQAGDGQANLRSRPSTEVGTILKVPNGTPVSILAEQTNSSGQLWYKVQVNGQTGWIYSELVQ